MARDRAVGVWERRGEAGGEDTEACGGEGEGLWEVVNFYIIGYGYLLCTREIYTDSFKELNH